MIQGIDGHRLARFWASDQVIEITVGVPGPNLLDDHCAATPVIFKPTLKLAVTKR